MRNGHAYTPAKTRKWESTARILIAQSMRSHGHGIYSGPLDIIVDCYFQIPNSWPQWRKAVALEGKVWHTVKPDIDNVFKAAVDAMTGVLFCDDAQVVSLRGHKAYAADPRVEITASTVFGVTGKSKQLGAYR